ncbi:hypothetical protein BDP81DRAFT_452527 [Colletotrichum phormii]|uniref:Uncharacterized protein n=1 Tax=Colletotrichum phormii TaxID=359342 RepID=A0AAI9ZK89_9PEZI|nr:uncharacterized protein BDP81DRAFT_452527 [Colletotrichum phormii]KAK1633454.1 hypothetical protein BDP81DRAFT_452527 [Colletotrichum phormii]
MIATEICGLVDCLLRLRVDTGDPAPHDRITSAKLRKDPEDYSFDVNFFKETWVRIEEFLAERLGSGSIKSVKTISKDEDLTLSEGARQILRSIEVDVKNVLHESTSDEFQCPYCNMTLGLSNSDQEKWMLQRDLLKYDRVSCPHNSTTSRHDPPESALYPNQPKF